MNKTFNIASKAPSNYSIVAAVIAVLIGIFFTYDLYSSSLQKADELEALRVSEVSVTKTLDALNAFNITANSNTDSQKYIGIARDDILLESIFALSGTGIEI